MENSSYSGTDPNPPLMRPPAGLSSNFKDPPSLANMATGVISVVILLEVFFLGVRLHNNIKTFRTLRADDWMAIFTTILTFGVAFCIIDDRLLARHSWNISKSMMTPHVARVVLASQIMIAPMIFAGKASVLLLYSRAFSTDSSFRWKIYVLMAINFSTNMTWVPLYSVVYSSSKGGWVNIASDHTGVRIYALLQGIISVIIDLITFYLPIPIILNLQLPFRRKLGLLAIFATGLCAIAACLIGLYSRVTLFQDTDIGYAAFVATLCSFVEAAIGVMCSSMPAMASFSKLYLGQTKLFTYLQFCFFGHRNGATQTHSVRISSLDASGKTGWPNATTATAGAKPSADSFPADSFTHLRVDSHNNSYGENTAAYPRCTTKTSVQVGSESSRTVDLEIGRIKKCVTITQVYDKATDDPSFPVRFESS